MIAKEIQYRFTHYAALLFLISGLSASYLFAFNDGTRNLLAVMMGLSYSVWGVWTHRGEVYTLRLVLEYVVVGMLGSVMLLLLT